jgi:hypothetical protein
MDDLDSGSSIMLDLFLAFRAVVVCLSFSSLGVVLIGRVFIGDETLNVEEDFGIPVLFSFRVKDFQNFFVLDSGMTVLVVLWLLCILICCWLTYYVKGKAGWKIYIKISKVPTLYC